MAFGVEKFYNPGAFLSRGTPIYGRAVAVQPKYGLAGVRTFFVDKPVDELPRIFPQGERVLLTEPGPTSRRRPLAIIQMYGSGRDIHIIHSPYYYYESDRLSIE